MSHDAQAQWADARPELLHIDALRQRLRALGARPVHEDSVLRHWTQGRPQLPRSPREDVLPAALREALPALEAEWQAIARLRSRHPGEDGSSRLLIDLADGQTIESVLLPREGLCVSSQVGCAVGCVFCMTGQGGLVRQLGSAEIVAQVALAQALQSPSTPIRKVVFMGMGEPAHNLEAVMDAITLLGTAGGIGHKNLVLSTVGDERVFDTLERLGDGAVKPALALSLHTTDPALRERLLPRAPRLSPAALMAHAEHYARRTHYPVQVQWTLIEGVNDSEAEIDGIVALLAGRHAVMNLIPYNRVDGLAFERPAWAHAVAMARSLHRRGVLTKLRRSAGQDVDAGCGQLRARAAHMTSTANATSVTSAASHRVTLTPRTTPSTAPGATR